MRKLFLIVILVSTFASLAAQSAEEEVIRMKQASEMSALDQNAVMDQNIKGDEETAQKKLPGHWNFSVGTSYSYMKGYGSGMMLYTAPTYTLSLNDRWSLHGGVIASHYQGLTQGQPGEYMLPGQFSNLSVFAAASYRASDRLVLHGAGVKSLVSAPNTMIMGYPANKLSFGASYKLGDNITIGASVQMHNRNSYYPTSFANPMLFPSTFGW